MKKIFILFISSFLIFNYFACSQSSVKAKKETTEKITMIQNKQNGIEIIPIAEMKEVDELKNFIKIEKTDVKIKSLVFAELEKYKSDIEKIDLVQISKWAKKEMDNYKLDKNFYKNLEVRDFYKFDKKYALNIKSISLPVHNPLVKRFLYIIPIYDFEKKKIDKIYVTIRGYVEE